MERFVCVNGSDNLQIPDELMEELSVFSPEQFHGNADLVTGIAGRMEKSGWVRLPFCNTLCVEALGAKPVLSMSGARVKEPPYSKPEELPDSLISDVSRLTVMLQALERLTAAGKCVSYNIEGPFSLLCAVLPMNRVFSALRKPSGAEMLSKAENWVLAYAALAVEHGAKMLSFADPVATVDILGQRMFTSVYVPCLKRVLDRLRKGYPHIPIHLCGKLTQSLLDVDACSAEIWSTEASETYGQTLKAFSEQGCGGIAGHFCLNFLDAKRPYIKLIIFK